MAPDTRLCTKCAALANRQECSICYKTLDRNMFPDSQWKWASKTKDSRNWFLRCTKCHTCTSCKVRKGAEEFLQASSQCTACGGKKECGVCGQKLPQSEFPASQWKHAGEAAQNWGLRCTACHCCATCSQIKNVRAFNHKAKDCIECQRRTETWRCDACDNMLQRDMFTKTMLHHAKWHNRKSVCLACTARGFSPRDVNAYHCAECGEQGHQKFAGAILSDYKRRGRRAQLVCTECCRRFASIEKTSKTRGLCDARVKASSTPTATKHASCMQQKQAKNDGPAAT